MTTARDELIRGVRSSANRGLRIESGIPKENAIILATFDQLPSNWGPRADLAPDSYLLKTVESGGFSYTVITAHNDR